MCNCQSLGECVEAVPTRNEFVDNFSKLDHSSKLWAELSICKSCGQHWIVEKGAEMDRRTNKAFKISKPDNWLEHDTNSALSAWLISQHGGTSEQNCAFSGCNNMALKSMAVCVEHGHSEYVWSKTT